MVMGGLYWSRGGGNCCYPAARKTKDSLNCSAECIRAGPASAATRRPHLHPIPKSPFVKGDQRHGHNGTRFLAKVPPYAFVDATAAASAVARALINISMDDRSGRIISLHLTERP